MSSSSTYSVKTKEAPIDRVNFAIKRNPPLVMRLLSHSTSAVALTMLLVGDSAAWVSRCSRMHQARPPRERTFLLPQRQRRQVPIALHMGPPKEEFLEDCDADPEGECEIDWDKMVFPDSNSDNNSSESDDDDESSQQEPSQQSMEQELYKLVKGGHTKDAVFEKTSHVDTSQARRGLEMAWQMQESQEECEVEKPESCSELCQTCHGTGMVACRFCHGSKVLALQGMASQSCRVCQAQGHEACQDCRGSGYIADWTQLRLQTLQ